MGDLNQRDFVEENRNLVRGPIIEIGSKNYGNTPDLRSLFPNEQYIGVDREPGGGVDVVCDLTGDFESVVEAIGVAQARTVICFSVLEHCKYPFKMAENISALLAEGGVVFVSVPFVWNIHAFPDDYWRFTPSAISLLFGGLQLDATRSFSSSKVRGVRFALGAQLSQLECWEGRGIRLFRLLRRCGFLRNRFQYVLPPTMVNMLFSKGIAILPKGGADPKTGEEGHR